MISVPIESLIDGTVMLRRSISVVILPSLLLSLFILVPQIFREAFVLIELMLRVSMVVVPMTFSREGKDC